MSEDRLQVLLVEDNPANAYLLQEWLSEVDRQLQLTHVECLDEALACLRRGGVDVVLLDLGLPDSTGLSAVDRTTSAAPHVPVIVFTGLEDETIAAEAVRRGAQDCLVKGQAGPYVLVRAMHRAVERKRQESALRENHTEPVKPAG